MLELFRGGALAAATLTTGLMAGLYYAYAISVMLGLSRTDDRTFVSAMQPLCLLRRGYRYRVGLPRVPRRSGAAGVSAIPVQRTLSVRNKQE